MIDQRTRIVLLTLSALFIVVAISIGGKLSGDLTLLTRLPPIAEDTTASARLRLINSAMTSDGGVTFFDYRGGFDSPFRKQGEISPRAKNKGGASAKFARVRLSLKGILSKDRSLAILESPTGETFIKGVGEMAGEQTIVSIKGNQVTLRDHIGTYDVVVEER
jgi:hypothetical protein